nr:uncharacterized protein LOC101249780 [Solanum lycopersicum]
MAFRSKEMMKKIVKNIGGEKNMASGVKERLEKCKQIPAVSGHMTVKEQVVDGSSIWLAHETSSAAFGLSRRTWKPNVQEKRLFSYIQFVSCLAMPVKIEKLYEELGKMELVFFTPEEETKLEEQFKEVKLEERAARREARRKMYGWSPKSEVKPDSEGEGSLPTDFHEGMVANA